MNNFYIMENYWKRFFQIFFLFLLILLLANYIKAQDCSIISKANDMIPDKLCAPVTVSWEVTYRGVNDNGTSVEMMFDWDDGTPIQFFPAVNTNPNPLIREWQVTTTHIYPQNGPACNYQPEATLRVNGVLCSSSMQQQNVTVWDTDDHNGGQMTITPQVFPICVGNDGTVTFNDASLWNCVPPVEIDNPNDPTRWTQWIYGTNYSINNVLVGGVAQIYPYYGNIVPALGPILGPQAPNNVSLPCYAPNTASLGQFFEVTLRNWNYCNPYDDPNIPGSPADLANGDYPPITTIAIILIVPYPNATIQPEGPFCSNAASLNLTAATPGGTWSGTGITNVATGQFSPSVAGSGVHTITYSVTNANGCTGIGTTNITVFARPTINILPGTNLQACPGDTIYLDGNPTQGSGVITTHLWTGNTGNLSATNIQTPYFTTNTPGIYNLTYRVTDINGCTRTQNCTINITQVIANILPDPAQACGGTDFQISGNPSGGTGTYTTHVWSGNTVSLNATNIQNPIFNTSILGSYNLTYTVTDNNGCMGTDNITVTVSSVPIANAGPDDSICGLNYSLRAISSIGVGVWSLLNGPGTLNFSASGSATSNVSANIYGTYDLIWQESFGPSCIDVDTVQITFIQQPVSNAGVDDSLCGLSTTLMALSSAGTGIWTQLTGPGIAAITNPSNSTTAISSAVYGMYSFQWFEDNTFGCVDSDTVNISFDIVPVTAFIPVDTNGCPPFNVNFINNTIGGTSYLWQFSDGGQSTSLNSNHTFLNNVTTNIIYFIELIATSTYGCKDSTEHQLTVHPSPVSNFIHDGVPSCSPVVVNFTNISSGATSFLWDFGDGTPTVTTNNSNHVFTNNTTLIQYYEIKLIAYNISGCPDTSLKYITVFPDPDYTISALPDTACHPANIQFITQPGAITYLWNFGDGTSQSAGYQISHPYINTGTTDLAFNLQLVGTSFFGCLDTSFVSIVVRPKPQAAFTILNNSGCSPANISFINTSTGAALNNWYWGDGTSEFSVNPQINHLFNNIGNIPLSINVSLIVYNNEGCFDSTSAPVTIYPNIIAQFVSDTIGCSPLNIIFQNQSSGGITYNWSFGDGTVSSQTNPNHIFSNSSLTDNVYNIQLTVTSVFGCIDSVSRNITVHPKPIAAISVSQPTGCTPYNATFTNTSTGANSFFYNFGDNTTDTSSNTLINHNYTNISNNPVSYTASLIIVNSFLCSDSLVTSVIVYPAVNALFVSDTSGCSPFTPHLNNLTAGASSFLWDFGDGSASTLFQPTHQYVNTTSYDIQYVLSLTATSAYGCTDSYIADMYIWANPDASFNLLPATLIFPISTASIDNTSSSGTWQYSWDFGDNTTSTLTEPGTHNYNSYGNYTVSLLVQSAHCSDTASNTIQIIAPKPIALFTISASGCTPLTVNFTNQSLYANSYLWNFGDGGFSTEKNPQYTFYNPGDYQIQLTASGTGGQDIIGGGEIHAFQYPTASFSVAPTVIFLPDQPVHCFNYSENSSNYLWDFGDGTNSNEDNPIHYFTQEGEFTITLIASTVNQCTDTFSIFRAVTAKSVGQISFPSAFSPDPSGSNGGHFNIMDYNNDVFHPVFVGVSSYELTIYNRWGELIFETKDPDIGWDGYYRGVLCKQDVYVWKVKGKFIDGKSFFKIGDVTLIR